MILEELGPRICILGAPNGLLTIHLDQLHHYPDIDWQARLDEEFTALHGEAVQGPEWIIDGNYSRWMTQRLERATGVIFLYAPTHISLYRYLRRTWFERERQRGLPSVRETLKWEMIHHIVATADASRKHNDALFRRLGLQCERGGGDHDCLAILSDSLGRPCFSRAMQYIGWWRPQAATEARGQ